MENSYGDIINNPLPMDKTWCEEVIISTTRRRGKGNVAHDPIRIITQVFLKDGTLIAEHDPENPPQQS